MGKYLYPHGSIIFGMLLGLIVIIILARVLYKLVTTKEGNEKLNKFLAKYNITIEEIKYKIKKGGK